jgi:hypothetical protein
MSGRATTSNGGGGWPRRWWERALAAVLVLIAIVVAILLYVVMTQWCNWYSCQTSVGARPDWPAHAIDVSVRRLSQGYGGESFDLPPNVSHERYMWYQPKFQPTYLFVAVTATYGEPGFGAPRDFLQVCRHSPDSSFGCSPVSCAGPVVLQDNSSGGSYSSSQSPIWGYYCAIAPAQPQNYSGYNPGTPYWGTFRLMVWNSSPQQNLRYTYVSNCDIRYPRGDKCPEDDISLPGQPGYTAPSAGYPTPPPTGGYTPPYPSTPGTPMSSPSTGGTGGH